MPSVDHRELAGLPERSAPGVEESARTPGLIIHKRIEDAPAWAVPYGKEFWRRQIKSAHSTGAPSAIS